MSYECDLSGHSNAASSHRSAQHSVYFFCELDVITLIYGSIGGGFEDGEGFKK